MPRCTTCGSRAALPTGCESFKCRTGIVSPFPIDRKSNAHDPQWRVVRIEIGQATLHDRLAVDEDDKVLSVKRDPEAEWLTPINLIPDHCPDCIVKLFEPMAFREQGDRRAFVIVIQIGGEGEIIVLILPEDEATPAAMLLAPAVAGRSNRDFEIGEVGSAPR